MDPAIQAVMPQIITAIATLAGSFGGVALTLRQQRARAWDERSEDRRHAVRQHFVDFLGATDDWAAQMAVMVVVLWKVRTTAEFMDVSKSATMDTIARLRADVQKSTNSLIASVADEELRGAVYAFHDLWINVPDKVTGPVNDTGRKDDPGAVSEALRYMDQVKEARIAVRNAGINLLAVAVSEDRHRQRLVILFPSKKRGTDRVG